MLKTIRNKAIQAKEWMLDYAYLVTLGAAALIVVGSAMATDRLRKGQEEGVQAAAQAPEILESAVPMQTPLPTAAPLNAALLKPGGTTVRPVSGKSIRGFSGGEPAFWEALLCMQPHDALDVSGTAGEDVRCAMDGVVTDCTRDELWGWSIFIRQMDGTTAVYRGIDTCALSEGERVTRGQRIGGLMERIPCEAELKTHLHLELVHEGHKIDPTVMFPD